MIGERILLREERKASMGRKIREEMSDMIRKATSDPPTATIGAVDSGFMYDEYAGMVILLIRSVGAIFQYKDGILERVTYHPSPLPDIDIIDSEYSLEREDVHPFVSLHRLKAELERAIQLTTQSPDYVFLDGSVVPQIVDKPHDSSPSQLKELYRNVISLFLELYHREPLVAGIVKDSRGSRLGNYLSSNGINVPPWSDTSWLVHVLEPGEYTLPIPYSEDPEKHATLKDVEGEHIYLFYIRPSPYDMPYRVEFYSHHPERDGDRLANLLIPLASINPTYAVPPFMVEIDMRARLGKESLKYVRSYIERILMGKFPHVKLFERRPFL